MPEAHKKVNSNSFIETDDERLVRDFLHDAFFLLISPKSSYLLKSNMVSMSSDNGNGLKTLSRRIKKHFQS